MAILVDQICKIYSDLFLFIVYYTSESREKVSPIHTKGAVITHALLFQTASGPR